MKKTERIALLGGLLAGLLLIVTACGDADESVATATETDTAVVTVVEPVTETEPESTAEIEDTSAATSAADTEKETEMETETVPVTVTVTETETEIETETETEAETESPVLTVARPGKKKAPYRIMYSKDADKTLIENASLLARAVGETVGSEMHIVTVDQVAKSKYIVLGSTDRADTAELAGTLQEGEYAIRVDLFDGENGRILIAYTTPHSQYLAVSYFIDHFVTPDGVYVPADLDVRGRSGEYTLITSQIEGLRDPCILAEDGVYYAYGTGWLCYKNTSGDLNGAWELVGTVASVADAADDDGNHWAPEVHKYGDAYYMFTTYKSKSTGHRGCAIFCSDSPEGPFVQITDGHLTPSNWDAIDGTFYVDPEGQPWMVFVHEWTSQTNSIGSFAAVQLSEDLTTTISEPFEMFYANEATWAISGVTDGCWMYTTAEGELLMIWSNFGADGYSVGIARSSNGRLDGEWTQEVKRLYCQSMGETYDGGHGMVFIGLDGRMYLSFHSPNSAVGERNTRACFLAIREENGMLIWDEIDTDME